MRVQEMIADSNPMVVANAVAALAEIHEASGKDVFQVTSNSLFKLLAALNECTEWGQVFILDSLVNYAVGGGHAVAVTCRHAAGPLGASCSVRGAG
jgi:vesicle coat complex subunit